MHKSLGELEKEKVWSKEKESKKREKEKKGRAGRAGRPQLVGEKSRGHLRRQGEFPSDLRKFRGAPGSANGRKLGGRGLRGNKEETRDRVRSESALSAAGQRD